MFHKQRYAFVLALLSFNQLAQANELKIEKINETIVDPEALYLSEGQWGNSVNGQSFQQDAVASFNGWQYATYYDVNRRLCIARRKLTSKNWEAIRFQDYTFKGNDTHNVTVLGICPSDGTIHLSFDHHGHPLHYRVSRPGVAKRPDDFPWQADLFNKITSELEPGKKLSRVTYPRFIRTPDGGLQFGCRIGSSGDGDKCLANYDPATGTWKNFGAYISKDGVYGKGTSRNPYLNGPNYDKNGRLHVTWCWRETGDPMTNHDLDYAWSDDKGNTWFNNVNQKIGERAKQLISIDSPEVKIATIPMNRGLINATTQATDSKNRIHLVTFHLPDDAPQQPDWSSTRKKTRYFHYWRDKKGEWHRNDLGFNGGRPQLAFDAGDNAYLIFAGDNYNPSPNLSIAAATAKTQWTDWKIIHREPGPFTGQAQLDRYQNAGLISVYIEKKPENVRATASILNVFDFRLNSSAK